MATIKDIAEKLNISAGTVSKGLNGGTDISEALRKQILETAVALGYTPKKARNPDTRSLALLIENMDYQNSNDFGYDIVLGFRQAALRAGWNVDVIPVDEDFQSAHPYDSYLLSRGYSAAFLCGLALNDPWEEQIRDTSVATVLLDNNAADNPHVCFIGTDSARAMELTISHLVSLGHEKIAFLDGSAHSYISDQRMYAYLSCMKKFQLPIHPNLAVYGYYVADSARYHVPGFLDFGATAIVCGNDEIAGGVIECCRAAGLSVPEDISVIGFDDLPASGDLLPPLTTIRQNRLSIGKCGVYLIDAMLDGCNMSSVHLQPKLILRDSTAIAKPRLASGRFDDRDSVRYINPQLYEQFVL